MIALQWDEWNDFYTKIRQDFSYSYEADRAARDFLARYVNKNIEELREILSYDVTVCGAGPTLFESIDKMDKESTVISCDGATTALLKKGVIPKIIVTDFDGVIEDIIASQRRESKIVVHAHGDNIALLKKYILQFGDIYGSTQIEPYANLYNFGGFTDGDRAVFLAEHFNPKQITLIGMDFDREIGKYSFTKNIELKKKKLKWAKTLIEHLKKTSRTLIKEV